MGELIAIPPEYTPLMEYTKQTLFVVVAFFGTAGAAFAVPTVNVVASKIATTTMAIFIAEPPSLRAVDIPEGILITELPGTD